MSRESSTPEPVGVLRIIARLNVGGPAIQVINLTKRLTPFGYRTTLLRGREGEREGNMDHLADELGVQPVLVPGLQRELGLHDLRALWEVMGWLRRDRPQVLHTHTAKAGAIGRLAITLMPWRRPAVVVHTFHGHVFEGEFSPRASRFFARVERFLGRRADRLIAVSEEVRRDLIDLGVAPPERVEVVRLGFDLSPFTREGEERERIRRETRERLGIPQHARVVSVVARVVKVKRIDRFLAMAREVAAREDVWFLVAGDGDKRAELEQSENAKALGERLVWAGFERDIPAICFASDVVALTSDNEGTPVCLIEAQAARVPVVTTLSGGVETVVQEGRTGRIVDRDPAKLAAAVGELLDDAARRDEWGRAGREHVLATFSIDRLVDDIRNLYERLLAEKRATSAQAGRRLVRRPADP
jgi:glycosyltransferase involved in cell wall biosynthesis